MGPRIFALSKSSSLRVQTERWRLKIQKVFKLAGDFLEKPVPHRFRHTFVRILLEKGVQPSDRASDPNTAPSSEGQCLLRASDRNHSAGVSRLLDPA